MTESPSNLQFTSKDGKEIRLILEEDSLQLIKSGRWGKKHNLRLPFKNILGIDLRRGTPHSNNQRASSGSSHSAPKDHHLIFHYVKSSSKNWTLSRFEIYHSDAKVVSSLRETILNFLKESDRPKKLLFYVNPYGGKGSAEKTFEKMVKPLLEIAGIQYEMELTLRRDHALDSIQTRADLENDFDGVVSVGGDGMFSEVFNGVLKRNLGSLDKPKIRVGIIPAGSTDALALSLHGTRDVLTCVLHILLGDKRNVDVTAIHTEDQDGNYILDRFSMAMASYGYFGDLLRRSEKYRWMGPRRYDYSGFRTFLANQSYEGNISFLGKEENYSDRLLCSAPCQTCENTPYIESDSRIMSHRVSGAFMAITAATLSCACEKTPNGISPYSHLGDGFSDLILVDKCSRFQYFDYLMRTGFKNTPNPFNLSIVRTYKIREMTFTPSSAKVSVWNTDGELVHHPSVRLVVHCQRLPVFTRGIMPKPIVSRRKFSFSPWIFNKNNSRQEEIENSSLVAT